MIDKYGDTSQLTGEIVDGNLIRQSFVAADNRLKSIKLPLATYKRHNQGHLIVGIAKEGKQEITSSRVNVAGVRDNGEWTFNFGIPLEKGKVYDLRIYSIGCRCGSAVTAKWGKRKHQGNFFNGAKTIVGELAFEIEYDSIVEPIVSNGKTKLNNGVVLPYDENSSVIGLIDIIIPHLDCQELLNRCLRSLARQSYNGFRVTVVDDGSEGKGLTKKIVNKYENEFEIRCLLHKSNRGASVARNTGANKATGEYLYFLDADCELKARALEEYVEALIKNPKVSWAYSNFIWGKDELRGQPFDAKLLYSRNFISTMSMIRRDHFPGFDESLKRLQDWDLWLTMIEKKKRGVWIDKVLFATPRRKGGISDSKEISWENAVNILREKHDF